MSTLGDMPQEFQDGYRKGWHAALRESLDERNRLARECADVRDQRDDLAREIHALKDHISIIDDDRRHLCDELEAATGRNWTDEEARRWSS